MDENDQTTGAVPIIEDKLAEAQQRNVQLEHAARTREHYEAFRRAAERHGARPKAIKGLWLLAEFDPENAPDQVDPERLDRLLIELRNDHDYCFESAEPAKEEPSRGRATPTDGNLTAEMRANPKFMLDPRNRSWIAAAARSGRVT